MNWSDPSGENPATLKDLEVVFQNVVGVVLGFGGIALFIMLLIGGFKYLTSGGDPKAVESAQKTLTTAILGLVLLIVSVLILNIIGNLTGIKNITFFKISLD